MGVDPEGGAGNKGAFVLAVYTRQELGVLRQNRVNGSDFVGKLLIQHMNEKDIPDFQLVKVRKQPLSGYTGMPCQNSVIAHTADGQRRSGQMPDAFFQHFCGRTVIDWKIHMDFGNLHIGHNAVSIEVQQIVITDSRSIQSRFGVPHRAKCRIIGIGGFQSGGQLGILHGFHLLFVLHLHFGLMPGVPVVTDHRVKRTGQSQQKYKNRHANHDFLLHIVPLSGTALADSPQSSVIRFQRVSSCGRR